MAFRSERREGQREGGRGREGEGRGRKGRGGKGKEGRGGEGRAMHIYNPALWDSTNQKMRGLLAAKLAPGSGWG